jgi:hypothetical protein
VITNSSYLILHWSNKDKTGPVIDYVERFREIKNRCYSFVISEKDMADLVLNSLRPYLKEKFEGFDFLTVSISG